MTRIPIDSLASAFSGEARAASGDSRDPALDEELRFDAHLRRAEKKPAGEDGEPQESDTAENVNAAEAGRPTEDRPESGSADEGEGNPSPTGDAESSESAEADTHIEDEGEADAVVPAPGISGLLVSAGDAPAPVNVAVVDNNPAPTEAPGEASQAVSFTAGSGEFQTQSPTSTESQNTPGDRDASPFAAETLDTTSNTVPEGENGTAEKTPILQTDAASAHAASAQSAAAQAVVAGSDRRADADRPVAEEKPATEEAVSNEAQPATVPEVDGPNGGDLDSAPDPDARPHGKSVSAHDADEDHARDSEATSPPETAAKTTPDANAVARATERTSETSAESTNAGTVVAAPSDGMSSEGRPVQAAAAASEPPPEGNVDGVDRSRFVRRVAGAFEAASRRGGPIRVQLTPPELGTLRLEIKVERGEIVARLKTDTQDARNVLLDNLPALRQRLEQQEIKVQRFDVEYDAGSEGSSPEPDDRAPHQGDGRQGDGRRDPAPRGVRTTEAEGPLRPRAAEETVSDGRLNLFA